MKVTCEGRKSHRNYLQSVCTAKEVQKKGLELPPRKHKIIHRVTHSTRERIMTSELFLDKSGHPWAFFTASVKGKHTRKYMYGYELA